MALALNYDFVAPQKIVFGWGRRSEIGSLGRSLGNRAFLVSGLPDEMGKHITDEIGNALLSEGIAFVPITTLLHEPEVDDVDRLAEQLRSEKAKTGDFLIGLGGGAAIDLAKAAAAMATNDQSSTVKDYLENVGRDLKIINPPLPVLTMPTTSGTGAEATKNAVISSYNPPFKKSLRDDRLMPRIALVDPQLTVSVPAAVTAASGMDAITQLFESYISKKAKPIPQALALQGLKLALPAIVEAVERPKSRAAREAMSHASLLSGISLANAGLSLAHGIAPAPGIHCRVAHGLACAVLLPAALKINSEVRGKELAKLSHVLYGCSAKVSEREAVDVLIRGIENIRDRIGIPSRLSQIGVRREQIPDLVKSSRGSSMSGNPRDLSDEELTDILEDIF